MRAFIFKYCISSSSMMIIPWYYFNLNNACVECSAAGNEVSIEDNCDRKSNYSDRKSNYSDRKINNKSFRKKLSPLDQSCHNPACSETFSIFNQSVQLLDKQHQKHKENINQHTNEKDDIPIEYIGCPADKNLLGLSSWNLLHTISANYPDSPSDKDKLLMFNFIESLAYLYPCPYCAKDFQESIKISPPRLESRKELCLWLCRLHNEVNTKLNKPVYPCSMRNIDERWKKGHANCWNTSSGLSSNDDDNVDDEEQEEEGKELSSSSSLSKTIKEGENNIPKNSVGTSIN